MSEAFRFCFLSFILFFIFAVVKFLIRVWWTPLRIQHKLKAQGIRGPSYCFIHGNNKQISEMRKDSMRGTVGLSHDIFPRIQPHLYAWTKKFGANFFFWQGPKAQLVITEPELVRDMLNNKSEYSRPEIDGVLKKILGGGILSAEGEKWARLRKISNHSFHGEYLKNMIPAMVESVESMLERWKKYPSREVELNEEFRLLTAEIISRTAFGSSYLHGEQIFKNLRKLVILSGKNADRTRLPCIRIFKNGNDMEAERLDKDIQKLITEMINRRESSTSELQNSGSDFLGALVKAYHDSDKNNRISLEEVIGECKTIYSAGHGTTATLLSWTVFLLALHTDWQEKARQEVLDVFGQKTPDSNGISRLKTMSMIINETLRLYPPATVTLRKSKRQARLGRLIIPADTNVTVPILMLHHDPRIWGQDSHIFKPDRFSEGVAGATSNNSAAFLPFGLGPRTCVGSSFAITEAKIALSMILQNYGFKLSQNHIHSPVEIITLRPQHGILVELHAL